MTITLTDISVQGGVAANREGYPLRPELIESIMYLYRATGDPWLIDAGLDILRSIQHSAWTPCGYATVKNVLTHTLEDRMESFFLAETTKYLYLLFDPDNFLHNRGNLATKVETPGGVCMLDAGGYIYNTEAHPIDPAALQCCSGLSEKEIKTKIALEMVDILDPGKIKEFRGDLVPERIKMLEKKRRAEAQVRKEREKKIREQIEAMAKKAQEETAAQKRKDEEKRQQIQQARDDAIYNATMSAVNASKDTKKVAGNEGEDYDDEEDEDEEDMEDEEDRQNNKPEFSATKESEVTSPSDTKPETMITKLSQGESLSHGGIVQPEKMVNIFEKKMNPVAEVLSSLVQRFVAVESQHFDLEKYTARLKTDLETRYKVEETWTSDYFSLTCPAVKFSDRFLVYGEFFTDKN